MPTAYLMSSRFKDEKDRVLSLEVALSDYYNETCYLNGKRAVPEKPSLFGNAKAEKAGAYFSFSHVMDFKSWEDLESIADYLYRNRMSLVWPTDRSDIRFDVEIIRQPPGGIRRFSPPLPIYGRKWDAFMDFSS